MTLSPRSRQGAPYTATPGPCYSDGKRDPEAMKRFAWPLRLKTHMQSCTGLAPCTPLLLPWPQHPPDATEDAIQVPPQLHQYTRVLQEALAHVLQTSAGQAVEVDQHLVGLLKAVEPAGRGGSGVGMEGGIKMPSANFSPTPKPYTMRVTGLFWQTVGKAGAFPE